MAGMYIYRC